MKVLRHNARNFSDELDALTAASSLFDPDIEARTREILKSVEERGDAAVLDCVERFQGARLKPHQLAVTRSEGMAASLRADPALRKAVRFADRNVAAFARRSRRKNWNGRNAQGAEVGEKFDPFDRVGVYIPGGTAPLVSTAIMTLTLARVAGCPEMVACTPCGPDGSIDSALLYAIQAAGATEIYRAGGAQAVAAMALGTESIRPVQKIFGPGNAYVVMAKRLLVGHVAIDLLPGPSEVLILADDSANPAFAAADLLAQAEHGSGHERVWLATTSLRVLRAVEREIKKQLQSLTRSDRIAAVLEKNGWLIHLKSRSDLIRLANRLAPEHCELMIRRPEKAADEIRTAGALFLGNDSPTVLGDYVAGPSHTLPTGGAGRSFAGLTVDQFQRRTSIVRYDRAALRRSLDAVLEFASMEGLDAHGRSAEIRMRRKASR